MSLFDIGKKLNATYLKKKGFGRCYWGSPHEWRRNKIFYEGSETVDCSGDPDAIFDEAEWIIDWFPQTFEGNVYIGTRLVDMRNRCIAQYNSHMVVSDSLKTVEDYEIFIESLKDKCAYSK